MAGYTNNSETLMSTEAAAPARDMPEARSAPALDSVTGVLAQAEEARNKRVQDLRQMVNERAYPIDAAEVARSVVSSSIEK